MDHSQYWYFAEQILKDLLLPKGRYTNRCHRCILDVLCEIDFRRVVGRLRPKRNKELLPKLFSIYYALIIYFPNIYFYSM